MNAEARQVATFVKGLKVGERCNVRRQSFDAPMVREITFVGREERTDGTWIVWRWKAEAATPEGRMDCGYSGYRITERDPQQVAA